MKKGFTLIEALLTMGIFSLLFYLASSSFIQIQKSHLLKDSLWQLVSIIRQTQSKSASGEVLNHSHLRFGILFREDYYQEFTTTTDYTNRQQVYDLVTDLPNKLCFIDFNLPDTCIQSGDCIIFSSIEGMPSASASISLENKVSGEKKTIFINEQGKVSY